MKRKRNTKKTIFPHILLNSRERRREKRHQNPPTEHAQRRYGFEVVTERGEMEFRRLFNDSNRRVYGNRRASGGFLVEMLKGYPLRTWSRGEKMTFLSLFYGPVRGEYWANVALSHLDDFTVIALAQHMVNDTSRFSAQIRELGNKMIASV